MVTNSEKITNNNLKSKLERTLVKVDILDQQNIDLEKEVKKLK